MSVNLIQAIAAWQLFGGLICMAIAESFKANGWEIANPYWCYHLSISLNWFGAILVSVLYNILCPVGALCYWIYWICTVGRRK